MELKDFTRKTDREMAAYDFREEVLAFGSEEDAVERFFTYKAVGVAEKKTPEALAYEESEKVYHKHSILIPKGEADSCPLLLEILNRLGIVSQAADTMNSGLTTIVEFLKPSSEQFEMNAACRKAHWGNQKAVWLYYHNEQDIRKMLVPAQSFLKVSYTIGNFIPCPADCNRPGTSLTRDYWDLTIWYIYLWFHGTGVQKEAALERLFWNGRYAKFQMETYGDWLARFGTWDEFVEQNFLQDYTEWAQPPYGRPKEFWDGHFEGPVFPKTTEQFEAFFTRATQCIEARSMRMVTALKGRNPE